ncbi:DinB family protein [Croceimicrobium sp.]|uniref:DinB family protein n=1 Tax=Croceimicrobium sp. TaxID=2828340 RepID=UPI003BAA1748
MDSIVPNYRPQVGDYPDYYQRYFSWASENQDLLESYQYAIQDGLEFWHGISESESEFSYETSKWTIKELVQHIIDVERVFVYRAMSIARGETKVLAGFDHDAYVENSGANDRSWAGLLHEYQHLKQSTYDFFESLNSTQWQSKGEIEAGKVSLLAIAYIIVGHDKHHQRIVKERYLAKLRKA